MARSLSANIYGADTNAMADMIASDALGSPSPNAHSGNPIDQSAMSKGASGNASVSEKGEAKVTSHGTGADSRAKSKGDCPK